MKQFIALMMIVVMVSSCGWKPRPRGLIEEPEQGPPEYKAGWRDGCESGMSAYGNAYMKMFHKLKIDVNARKSPMYTKAWGDAYNYCRHYTNAYLASGYWSTDVGSGKAGTASDLREGRAAAVEGLTFPAMGGIGIPGWN